MSLPPRRKREPHNARDVVERDYERDAVMGKYELDPNDIITHDELLFPSHDRYV